MAKQISIPEHEIKPIAEGHGDCFATDMITIENRPVGYMYRELPEFDLDSGWRFFSGTESHSYIDNPDNLGLYDVNTIANFDPDVVPFLELPVGSVLERQGDAGEFCEIIEDQ